MTQFTIRCHHRFQPTPPPVDARAWDSSHHSPPTRLTRVLRSRSRQARKPPRRQRAPPRARRGARPRRRRGALRCELAFAQRRSASRERRATVRRRRCTASRRRAPSQAGPLGRTSGSPRPRPRGPCAAGSRAAGAVPVPERKPGWRLCGGFGWGGGPRARAEARNGPAAAWLGACAAGGLGVGDAPRMARESSKRTRQPAVSAEYQGAMVPLETTSRSRWASGYPGSIRAACLTLFAAKELVHDHQWRYPAAARAACSPRTR